MLEELCSGLIIDPWISFAGEVFEFCFPFDVSFGMLLAMELRMGPLEIILFIAFELGRECPTLLVGVVSVLRMARDI